MDNVPCHLRAKTRGRDFGPDQRVHERRFSDVTASDKNDETGFHNLRTTKNTKVRKIQMINFRIFEPSVVLMLSCPCSLFKPIVYYDRMNVFRPAASFQAGLTGGVEYSPSGGFYIYLYLLFSMPKRNSPKIYLRGGWRYE